MGTWCKDFWSCCKDFLSCCKDSMSCRRVFWSCCKDFLAEPVFKKYLFSWDNVPGNDNDTGRLRRFLIDDLAYLFSITSNFKKDLEDNKISNLRKVFNDNKHPLSSNAINSKVNENEWKIRDVGKEYKIKELDNKLKIYNPDIGWTENAKILKSYDEKTIRIFKDEKSAEIMMDETKGKATLKISDKKTIDLKVKKKDDKRNIYYVEFPHSQVWRVLATIIVVILGLLLCNKSELIMTGKSFDHWAILSIWTLILYLSLILWLPFHNIWECIEKVDYAAVKEEEFREKIRSTLVAFSIAFIVLSLSIITAQTFHDIDENVLKPALGLLIGGVILLIVTFEVYDSCLNPAFNSAQIERLYTKGWWFYTFGIYSIVIALLLYVYSLEPRITIIGVIIFIVAFTYYLRTRCEITK